MTDGSDEHDDSQVDHDVTEDSESADESMDSPGTRTPARTVPFGAFLAAVLVAAALGILAVVALSVGGESDAGNGDVEDARLAAGRFAERFLTFEHDNLDEWKKDVLALSTGGFAEEVESVESSLREMLGTEQISARSHVRDVFIGNVDNDSVTVVVLYDREVDDPDGDRVETNGYARLDMVRSESRWLVEQVVNLTNPGGSVPVPDAGSPSTTAGDEGTGGG